MKNINIFLIFLLFISVLNIAYPLSILKKSERYGEKRVIQKVKVKRAATARKRSRKNQNTLSQILKKMSEGNQNIKALNSRIEKRHRVPIVLGRGRKVKMLQEFTGVIYESLQVIVGASSKLKVRLIDSDLIAKETEFRCIGSAKGVRIKAYCDRMITDDRIYKIKAYLKDHYSGADTLFPSDVYSYDEEGFFKKMFTGALDAVFDVSKDRVLVTNGEIERKNARNKVLTGAMGATSEVSKNISKSVNQAKTILTLNAGKKVIIIFDEEVKL